METQLSSLLAASTVSIFLLCAIFASVGARQKGRSEFGWFVVGLLTAPFALLVYAMPSMNMQPAGGARTRVQQPPIQRGLPIWIILFAVLAVIFGTLYLGSADLTEPLAELEEWVVAVINYIRGVNPLEIF